MGKKVIVIGAGFSGLSAATARADKGFEVEVLEKNADTGGRARKLVDQGYVFDMGPSWYWLPDVFEEYFARFGKRPSDYYQLVRLDPSYRIFFGAGDYLDVPAGQDKVIRLFEDIEPGSGPKLERFLSEAKFKYDLGVKEIVYKPSHSFLEYMDTRIIKGMWKLSFFRSVSGVVRKLFKDTRLVRILEFPVIFLGATPWNTPALYTMMNHADIGLGTWYPMGGMHEVIAAMEALAVEKGVKIRRSSPVESIVTGGRKVLGVMVNGKMETADAVVGSADYHHVEQQLLPEESRTYTSHYWEKRDMAPSTLLYFVGVNKPLKTLLHHNLFFDTDFEQHASDIYDKPAWPNDPALYVSCNSRTDPSVAPPGHENLVILIPVAPGLKDTPAIREKYFELAIRRLEHITGEEIKPNVVYTRSYAHSDFIKDYHAFKGNAYGLSNTLFQTAFLKPKMRSKKLDNLYYTGQLTVPGPGVPPSIISGLVVAAEVKKTLDK
jgi:phytoene desaturase